MTEVKKDYHLLSHTLILIHIKYWYAILSLCNDENKITSKYVRTQHNLWLQCENEWKEAISVTIQVVLASDVLGCCFVFDMIKWYNDKMAYHHLMLISIRVCDGTVKIQLKSREKHLDDSSNVTRICILPTFKLTHTEHWEHKKNSLVKGLYFPVLNYCLFGCLSVWMLILSVIGILTIPFSRFMR